MVLINYTNRRAIGGRLEAHPARRMDAVVLRGRSKQNLLGGQGRGLIPGNVLELREPVALVLLDGWMDGWIMGWMAR